MKRPLKPRSIKVHLKDMDAKKLLRNKKVIEEINRHKWLESEIAGYDVGFEAAAEDWLKRHAGVWIAYHDGKKSKSLPAVHLPASKGKRGLIKFVPIKKKRSLK